MRLGWGSHFYFSLDTAIQDFEDGRMDADSEDEVKPCIQVKEMDIYEVNTKYYFIASESDIFLLNDNDRYSVKLSETEIEALDFSIVWLGPNRSTQFESNDEKAVIAVVKIIEDFNSMVESEEFHGFAVASIVTHLRAYLYEHILKEQRSFYTSIVLSGKERGTGMYVYKQGLRRTRKL